MAQTDKRTIGICIPTYNKCDDVVRCIELIKDDERVLEITIIDDASPEVIWWMLEDVFYEQPKVRLGRNDEHLGIAKNKHRAILLSDSEWILLVNPECELEKEIIDEIFNQQWSERTVDLSNGNLFLNRKKYLDDSLYSVRLEKQEEGA